jgi:hypothetical protein
MISRILLDILAPILLMVLLGAIMRWKYYLDLGTLSKLNLYLFVPAFIFHHLSTSALSWTDMGGIVGMTAIQVTLLGIIVWGIGKMLGVGRKTLAAVALAVMFHNSGNYGLPLAELAYQSPGAAAQTFVLVTQNILTYTVGLSIAALTGSGHIAQGIITLFRMPILPTLAAALLARWWIHQDPGNHQLPIFISKTAAYLSAGLIPVALVTLGAQLASHPRWPRWRPVCFVLFLRLIFAPLLMAAFLYLFHRLHWRFVQLWPWPAELLILTAGTPTAVNTLLMTMELEGDTELAADCVFWTTVASCITITLWLFFLKQYMPS